MYSFGIILFGILNHQISCQLRNLSLFPVPEHNLLDQMTVEDCYENCLNETIESTDCYQCIEPNHQKRDQEFCCFHSIQIKCTFDCLQKDIGCLKFTYSCNYSQFEALNDMRNKAIDYLELRQCPDSSLDEDCLEKPIGVTEVYTTGPLFSTPPGRGVSENNAFIICLISTVLSIVCFAGFVCILNIERQHFIDLRTRNMKNESFPPIDESINENHNENGFAANLI